MDNDVNRKINFVDQYIDGLARKLADNNKPLEGKLKSEITRILLQNDLQSSSEETSSLLRILSEGKSVADTETRLKAKEAVLEMSQWEKDNGELIRTYRKKNLSTTLVEKTIANNRGISQEGVSATKSLGDAVNEMFNGNGVVENQKDSISEAFKHESPGKVKNAWNDTRGVVELLKQEPEQLEKTVANYEKITTDIQKNGIKIPYENFDKVASYDRVMNSIKNPEMRRFMESARSRFKILDRISNGNFSHTANNFISKIKGERARNIANNFFNKSIVKISNGFASKIGNQAARDFVQNSMGSILKNGVSQGMKSVMQGAMKKGAQLAGKAALNVATKMGVKAAALGLKAALGAATAGLGYIAMAGWEVLKLGGKFLKALGVELTNNKIADTVIVVFIMLIALLGFIGTANADIVSSLVPEVDTESVIFDEDYGDYTNDMEGVPIPGQVVPCSLDTASYQEELMSKVNAAGFRTRAGVAAAAKYLSSEFGYKVPYYFGGGHNSDVSKDRDGGLTDDPSDGLKRKWGCTYPPDSGGRTLMGLDCSGFVTWCYLTAGFKDWKGSGEYRWNRGSFQYVHFGTTDCKELASKVKPGDVLKSDGHTGIILWVEGTIAKNAQSTPRGLIVEYTNLCNGKGVNGSKNDFPSIVLMENYFIKNK